MVCKIAGTGSALPKRVVTNDDLAHLVETSDEWIASRTGIRERRILTDESIVSLAALAVERALEDAGLAAADVDLVIGATSATEYRFPQLASAAASIVGIKSVAFDIGMACTGFVAGVDLASAYIDTGRAKTVVVVAAEAMSDLVDWSDRSTCVLFGDGAGAVVMTRGEGFIASHFIGDPNPGPLFSPSPLGNSPFRTGQEAVMCHAPIDRVSPHLVMEGQEVFKFAVTTIVSDITEVLEKANLPIDQVDHFVLHQANMRIVESARTKLDQPIEKFPTNIERTGNTSAASVPILLDELNRAGALTRGDLIVMAAFGAGLQSGAVLMEWTK